MSEPPGTGGPPRPGGVADYRALFHESPYAMWVYDVDTLAVVEVNQAALAMYGYARAEFLDLTLADFQPSDGPSPSPEGASPPGGHQGRRRHRLADGGLIEVELIERPVDGAGRRVVAALDVTDRARTERELERNLAQTRALVEANPDLVFRIDSDGRYLSFWPTDYVELLLPPDQFLGKRIDEVMAPELAAHARGAIAEALATGSPQVLEYRLELGGVEQEFEARFAPIAGVDELLVLVRDITSRKRAEAALLDSEARFRSAFEHTPVGMALVDPAGGYRQVNTALCAMLGYPEKELLGLTVADVSQPEDLELDMALRDRLLAGELPSYVIEKRYLHADGHAVVGMLSVSLVRDAGGRPSYLVEQIQDISSLKEAEVQLARRARQQEAVAQLGRRALEGRAHGELLQQAVAMLRDVLELEYAKVLELHPHYFVLRAGAGWKPGTVGKARVARGPGSQAGYTLLTAEPVIVEDLASETRFAGPSLLVDHGVVSGMSVVIPGSRGPYGVLGAHSTSRRSFTSDDTHFLQSVANVLADAIEHSRAEEALASSAAQVEERNRELERSNADLAQFAYVASHDLSEPLRTVSTHLQLLARRYQGALDADADEFIGFALQGVERMRVLIRDLLEYSRAGTVEQKVGPVRLDEVASLALEVLAPVISERGAKVEVAQLPVVAGDETQLQRVFQNLLSNALKFVAQGTAPHVTITAGRDEGYVVISVRDNGIGIAPQHRDRIFLPFKRLSPHGDYPGTGIGLTICKRVVERHGGRIWVESSDGQGTVVSFALPVAGLIDSAAEAEVPP